MYINFVLQFLNCILLFLIIKTFIPDMNVFVLALQHFSSFVCNFKFFLSILDITILYQFYLKMSETYLNSRII